jgi:hypothetical protein
LCTVLPAAVEEHPEFGLPFDTDAYLLVLPQRSGEGPVVLCYGPWPGLEAWETWVEPKLPWSATLPDSRWNTPLARRLGVPSPRSMGECLRAATPGTGMSTVPRIARLDAQPDHSGHGGAPGDGAPAPPCPAPEAV